MTNTTVNDSAGQLEPARINDHADFARRVLANGMPCNVFGYEATALQLQAGAIHAQLAQVAALQQIFTALTDLTIAVKRFGA